MFSSHAPHAEARLRWVQTWNKLGRVACIAPHDGSMVAHIRGRQGEEWLAGLIRRDGCNVSGAVVRLGGLSFTSIMVGATVRAAVAAVCAGPYVAGVCMVWTFRPGLIHISVFFGIVVIAAGCAGGTAVLMCRFTTGSLGLRGGLSTGRMAVFVELLLLSMSWRGAAASRAGRSSVG